MDVTLFGILIDVIILQLEKADFPIDVTVYIIELELFSFTRGKIVKSPDTSDEQSQTSTLLLLSFLYFTPAT